jgi:hypothetical protein
LLRRGFALEYATLAWNVAGIVVLAIAAVSARSVALAGFGLDSLIEIGASAVVVWELSGTGAERQRRGLRLIGYAFAALAVYLLAQSTAVLVAGYHPRHSVLGIIWTALTAAVMFMLASGKASTGRALRNPVLTTEGRVTMIDGILAVAVLLGLALNAGLGWWWADPAAGYVLVFYAGREVREIFSGLHGPCCEGDADADEDEAADELTPLACLGAEPAAQFQADQRHRDADGTDHYGGQGQADVIGAQGEANGEVVDAQRDPGDQQPPGRRPGLGARLVRFVLSDCLPQGVKAGGDQQARADPARGMAEYVRESVPEQQAEDRHAGLEQTEHDPHAQPGTAIDTRDANAHRCREVGQPQRGGDQQQGEHETTLLTTDRKAGRVAESRGTFASELGAAIGPGDLVDQDLRL